LPAYGLFAPCHVRRRARREGHASRRSEAAEALAADLPWDGGALDPNVARRFGEAVAAAAAPIDDVRGAAAYRRHALAVLARRALSWTVAGLTGQISEETRNPDRSVGS